MPPNESPSKRTHKLLDSLVFTPEKDPQDSLEYLGEVPVDFYNNEESCNVSGEPIVSNTLSYSRQNLVPGGISHSKEMGFSSHQNAGRHHTITVDKKFELSYQQQSSSGDYACTRLDVSTGRMENWRLRVAELISALPDKEVRTHIEGHLDMKLGETSHNDTSLVDTMGQ